MVTTLRVRISGKRPTQTELVRGLPGRSPDKRSDGQVRSIYDESNLELREGSELNLSTVGVYCSYLYTKYFTSPSVSAVDFGSAK